MTNYLEDILKKTVADYAEIRWEETNLTKINYLGQELEEIAEVEDIGGCVRVLIGGGWGFVSFNKVEDAYKALKLSEEYAIKIKRKKIVFPKIDPRTVKVKTKLSKIPLSEKHRVIKSYNDSILSCPKMMSSQVRYNEVVQSKYLLTTDNVKIEDKRQWTAIRLSAIAREGLNVQTVSYDKGEIGGFEIALNLEEKVKEICAKAQQLLRAEPISAGKYTVIMDQELTGLFAHEAFGHLAEADFLYENPELQKVMKIGKKFGSDSLNIIDDGTIPHLLGTREYDDEGVKTQKVYLVKNGIFNSLLHSRETARKMGKTSTGSARAINYLFPPIVRMSNTYVEGNKYTFEEMLSSVKFGIYAKGSRGGQTNGEMFTFNATEGYLIKDGKITKMLRDITLSGNVFETLHNIEMIGKDVQFYGGIGGCGKDGQSPLPITLGGPHIKVKDVVVGGK